MSGLMYGVAFSEYPPGIRAQPRVCPAAQDVAGRGYRSAE